MWSLTDLVANFNVLLALVFVASLYLSIKIFPIIISLTRAKNLMADPCDRSSHSVRTPNLGGVGIFIVFTLCLTFSGLLSQFLQMEMRQLLALLAGVTILFFVGVKDDLVGVTPLKKLAGQFVAALIVVLMTDVRINSMFGILGIETLAYIPSVLFTVFLYVFFINSYNLIDGIDGLAGSIAIIASMFFGVYFVANQLYLVSFISFALVGCLIGFLIFNFSKKEKLFMGDSGSMFIGFLLMFEALSFLKMDVITHNVLWIPNKITLVCSIFCFPILDTIRVFFIRLLKGVNPMSADRNHIHHKILDVGFNHVQATAFIAVSNILVISAAYFIGDYNVNTQLFIVFSLLLLIVYLFLIFHQKIRKTLVRYLNIFFYRSIVRKRAFKN